MSEIKIQISSVQKTIPKPETLGFGQYFTDHMFVAEFSEDTGWSAGSVLPYGPISLDPGASVFHYGQALFEGIKAFRNEKSEIVVFRPHYNIDRLKQGAGRLCMVAPPEDLFLNGLTALLKVDQRWIPSEDGCALYIRPTLIGSEAFLGVRPSKKYLFYILLSPVGSYYSEGTKPVKIWAETEYTRAAIGGLGATKAGANYAASLKAAFEAKKKGYSQVLWLDPQKENIEEVGTMNVFFVFKNKVVTPALNGSILAGSTRDCVLHLLKKWNVPVEERKIGIKEVTEKIASGELIESFGTGTAAVISPIGEILYQNKSYIINNQNSGDLSLKLLNELQSIQKGRIEDTLNWIYKV